MDIHSWHVRGRIQAFATHLCAAGFYYSGLVALARRWTQCSGRRVIILNYHRASTGDLRSHLLYLRRHYRVLPLEQALEEIGAPAHHHTPAFDARTRLVITFDDGYLDHYTDAARLATELKVPITIFLIPGYIGSGRHFWWQEGAHLVGLAQIDVARIAGQAYHLGRAKDRQRLVQLIAQRARFARSVAEREDFLASVRKALGVSTASVRTAAKDPGRPLTWAEVRRMEETGWVSFGAHSMNHPVLSYLTDPAEIRREVAECRTVIEAQLGHPVRTFAYPIGKAEHIGQQALQAVREADYRWAISTIPGLNCARTDPYLLRRTYTDASEPWWRLAAQAAGIWPPPKGSPRRTRRFHRCLPETGARQVTAHPHDGKPVTADVEGSGRV